MHFLRKLLFLVVVFLFSKTQAQVVTYGHHCAVKADAGVSQLRSVDWQWPPATVKSPFCFSWRAGLSYSYRFKNFLGCGADFMYTPIAGKQVYTGSVPTSGSYTYTYTEQLPFISIPFYLTAHYKKFSLSVGGDYMRYLGSGSIKTHSVWINAGTQTSDGSVPSSQIMPGDFGLYGSLAYRFHQRFAATINFYRSWIDIGRGSQVATISIGPLRTTQITAGLAYNFFLKETKKQKATSVRDMD